MGNREESEPWEEGRSGWGAAVPRNPGVGVGRQEGGEQAAGGAQACTGPVAPLCHAGPLACLSPGEEN